MKTDTETGLDLVGMQLTLGSHWTSSFHSGRAFLFKVEGFIIYLFIFEKVTHINNFEVSFSSCI